MELAEAIRDLEGHLRCHGDEQWSDALGRAASFIEAGEAQGLYLFQRMHGGMGSFNDLVLPDGNEQLAALHKRAWELAQYVDRSHLRV